MVQLCEKNETYVVLNPNIKSLIAIEGRRVVGVAGQTIDRLLTRFDKRRYLFQRQLKHF